MVDQSEKELIREESWGRKHLGVSNKCLSNDSFAYDNLPPQGKWSKDGNDTFSALREFILHNLPWYGGMG